MVFYGETAELEIYQFELQTNETRKNYNTAGWLAVC